MEKVRFALPKGHLADATFQTLKRAGYNIYGGERTYRPSINDPNIELKVLRPQEIPVFVSEGLQDIGITGLDWVEETGADVEILLNLEYSKVDLIIAVPKCWTSINSLSDLLEQFYKRDKNLRISTEYLNISTKYLKDNLTYTNLYGDVDPFMVTPWWKKGENGKVAIYLSFGATEAKPPENADAIVEVIETGVSLEENDLKAIESIMQSNAILIANKKALKDHVNKEKLFDILTLLKGVVDGRKKLHIFVNVNKKNLQVLLKKLPALRRPTVAPLSDEEWYSVNTVIERDQFLDILPSLRKLSQGLVVYEPRQVLPFDEINLRS
jgi:ATP phosphoribosyltransferase